jgi:trehalose utilization protein
MMQTMCRLVLIAVLTLLMSPVIPAAPIRVVVWDEQNPAQKKCYPNYLGNQIATYLRMQPGLAVTSVGLNDPDHGLSDRVLTNCDVLIWWSHVRNKSVPADKAREIVQRVKDGELSLVILHSALASKVFIEAMNERTRGDAAKTLPAGVKTEIILPPAYKDPKPTDPLTPRIEMTNAPDGSPLARVFYPLCEISAWRETGEPVKITTLLPDHPIARGVPAQFDIAHTEVYSEPFHVPKPDATVFEEVSTKGEIFRAGMVWTIGRGKVFYFSPGHETFPIYFQPAPLKIIGNAVDWLGGRG